METPGTVPVTVQQAATPFCLLEEDAFRPAAELTGPFCVFRPLTAFLGGSAPGTPGALRRLG